MKLLEQKILSCGKVYPGNILKVDSFINHQIDIGLLAELSKEVYSLFQNNKITKILTIESGGIALASLVAQQFAVPLVYAKKVRAANMVDTLYSASVTSYTHNKTYEIVVSKEFVSEDDCVLLVDDFLANGCALRGLVNIVNQANATVVGAAIAIEKGFQDGGAKLRAEGLHIESLAILESMTDDGKIIFRS
ncbi:MAG: xanthine phosphoribosyltransferase [Bacillota bacterium]